MFNIEYEFNLDQMSDMLQFPHEEGVISETPLDIDSVHEVGPFWEQLTRNRSNSFKGNNATQVHNPAIHYFRQFWHALFLARIIKVELMLMSYFTCIMFFSIHMLIHPRSC